MLKSYLIAICILLPSGTITCQAEMPDDYQKCIDDSDGKGVQFTGRCIDDLDKKIDKELNSGFKSAIDKNTNNSAFIESLRISERAWLIYRDKTCITEGRLFAGTNPASLERYEVCVYRITEERIEWFKRASDQTSP